MHHGPLLLNLFGLYFPRIRDILLHNPRTVSTSVNLILIKYFDRICLSIPVFLTDAVMSFIEFLFFLLGQAFNRLDEACPCWGGQSALLLSTDSSVTLIRKHPCRHTYNSV